MFFYFYRPLCWPDTYRYENSAERANNDMEKFFIDFPLYGPVLYLLCAQEDSVSALGLADTRDISVVLPSSVDICQFFFQLFSPLFFSLSASITK